ncbi:MAG: Holliday junction resolvase RuvX [Bacteroidota bacterium]|nr:Holliday junction resolvase RuvX [Bacteroidota bacterium]
MGRILGIDFGTKRIGIAVTDPMQIIASPLTTVRNNEFVYFLTEYLKDEDVEAFVIGYPLKLNNKPSESVKYLNPFIRRIKKLFPGKPVHLIDERFTSGIAQRTILEGGVRKRNRQDKFLIDKISASIILQSFLDGRANINKA